MTGTEQPQGRFNGRAIEPIIGKNLMPILNGSREYVYTKDDFVGYEVAGNLALFSNGYKLVMNRPALGDGEWYLYDIVNDPGETTDLKQDDSVQFQHMINLYQRYTKENGVLPVPEHYDQDFEVGLKIARNKIGDSLIIMALLSITLSFFALISWKEK
jgi:arylsulfatase/uncharacterized sulfatase